MKKKYFTEEERKQAKKEYQKEYRKNHKEKSKTYAKGYYRDNKEKWEEYRNNHKKEIKISNQKYRKNHRKQITTYVNNKLKIDIDYKLRHHLRNRLRVALHNNQKSGSAVKDLGCSIPELKIYLESKFQEKMSWDNYGFYGWHIDHIIPLDFFNLQDREEFLKACHYTNLQPMWANDNYIKSNKLEVFETSE